MINLWFVCVGGGTRLLPFFGQPQPTSLTPSHLHDGGNFPVGTSCRGLASVHDLETSGATHDNQLPAAVHRERPVGRYLFSTACLCGEAFFLNLSLYVAFDFRVFMMMFVTLFLLSPSLSVVFGLPVVWRYRWPLVITLRRQTPHAGSVLCLALLVRSAMLLFAFVFALPLLPVLLGYKVNPLRYFSVWLLADCSRILMIWFVSHDRCFGS